MGRWVEETKFTHHYFEDEKEADDPKRVRWPGDAMVEKGRSGVFGGLWYAVVFGDGPTGNFFDSESAREWVEEQVADQCGCRKV